MITITHTKKAPEAIGPYSQAFSVDNFIFCSGQIGLDPQTGKLVNGLAQQIHQIMANIKEILLASNSNLDNIIKTTIFLINMSDFPEVNKIYGQYFRENKPARSTVGVATLPKDALIEIEVIAIKK